ncbi:MAG: molybdopterin-guanine dinucleotide biosynthesis protein B [Rhodospirillales bacterium]|nr:molybdopterin-guanine dinucleotide biosynthesis protein B [Rhodospirillales bacterium]
MKVFGLVGWSGSGKTTLLTSVLPELARRGLTVSTMKHTHHRFDVDKPGKDSFEHREAGANEVMVVSSKRWALMHEHEEKQNPDMDQLIGRMAPVDLLLIEGFKQHRHAKLEVHRPAVGKPLLCLEDPGIIAVASDEALTDVKVPVLDLNDSAAVTQFILDYCGIGTKEGDDAA